MYRHRLVAETNMGASILIWRRRPAHFGLWLSPEPCWNPVVLDPVCFFFGLLRFRLETFYIRRRNIDRALTEVVGPETVAVLLDFGFLFLFFPRFARILTSFRGIEFTVGGTRSSTGTQVLKTIFLGGINWSYTERKENLDFHPFVSLPNLLFTVVLKKNIDSLLDRTSSTWFWNDAFWKIFSNSILRPSRWCGRGRRVAHKLGRFHWISFYKIAGVLWAASQGLSVILGPRRSVDTFPLSVKKRKKMFITFPFVSQQKKKRKYRLTFSRLEIKLNEFVYQFMTHGWRVDWFESRESHGLPWQPNIDYFRTLKLVFNDFSINNTMVVWK